MEEQKMKADITEGELIFLKKIRGVKDEVKNEYTQGDKLNYLKHKIDEITRYVVYEILGP